MFPNYIFKSKLSFLKNVFLIFDSCFFALKYCIVMMISNFSIWFIDRETWRFGFTFSKLILRIFFQSILAGFWKFLKLSTSIYGLSRDFEKFSIDFQDFKIIPKPFEAIEDTKFLIDNIFQVTESWENIFANLTVFIRRVNNWRFELRNNS